MWYAIGGFGALLYLVLIVTLGVATIRNGQLGPVHPRDLPADLLDHWRPDAAGSAGGLN